MKKNDIENSILANYDEENHADHTYCNYLSGSFNVQCSSKPDKQRNKLLRAAIQFLEKFVSCDIIQNAIKGENKIEETQIEVAPKKVSDSVIETKSDVR